MIKLLTVVGARPQFIKAAAVSRAIRMNFGDAINEIILHTGQHYDNSMSKVFFEELEIPLPLYNLGVGSCNHGEQTAEMIKGIEEIIINEKPTAILVYGDTNSTLAGALAAAKLHVPVAHIEAGMRSFNKLMPEEINRVLCDHISTFLFTPTLTGLENLMKEGIMPDLKPPYSIDIPMVMHCGDLMYDNTLYFKKLSEKNCDILRKNNLTDDSYVLATIHRDNNTDNPIILREIIDALGEISKNENMPFVLPLHPRTRKAIESAGINIFRNIIILEPATYFEMLLLESHASMIITDSGGVQKESYFFRKKCLVLRNETEWVELIEQGSVALGGNTKERIIDQFYLLKNKQIANYPKFYGDGNASAAICTKLKEALK